MATSVEALRDPRGGSPVSMVELLAYQPAAIYTIELWRGGDEVRVFTNGFAARLASGRARFRASGF